MQTCLIKLNSTEIRKIHGFKNKSGIAVYGNKLEYIKVFCWVCGFGQKISLFLCFLHLLFAVLAENERRPHETISGVGAAAAV